MLMEIMEEDADWCSGGTDMDSGDHVFSCAQVSYALR